MSWTPDNIEQLKALWADGKSCSQIARILGNGISRNAVIGKIHRMGLNDRPTPQRLKVRAFTPFHKLPPAPEPEIPETEPIAAALDNGALITTLTIGRHQCRWPFGDPALADFHYCGNVTRIGFVYCDFHTRRAYAQAANPRRKHSEDELAEIARNERALERAG